ncbi:serine hydrolase [Halobiforma lacisalsi AJ5]|uniref:Beta-lactamase n=1 Tax=Natronobacterium lacisalsi AJ5 TaxID=358396 RepID=M0LPW2_NATLA|nr:serine hydrolase domain-containing protein [Halobiforma lacisalsi]APW99609.1 serine hydrolase [Halobiforma lacisalsi AJ5]EMA35607.1 beta-lactamase [Halobiforma lacisalsi AJ5]
MASDPSRRRFLGTSALGLTASLAGCLGLGGDGSESLPAHLEERIPTLLERYDVPGTSVALVEDGAVTWTGAYGEADPAAGRPTTEDTPFRVQSITKSVTAWAVMKLVETGEIDLEDPIERHVTSWELPDAPHPWDEVTVRRLLSHSAGIPPGGGGEVESGGEPPSIQTVLSGAAGTPAARPVEEPGTFRYSNPGYALLELLVEDVTGRDFAAYVDDEILTPLGMDDATFDRDDLEADLAIEHYVDGTPVETAPGPVRAHGGLYATAEDVARFVAASTAGADGEQPGRDVLEPESVAKMHEPAVETTGFYDLATDGAGLGHFAETLSGGERAVMNGGQGPGSWNWFHAVPSTGDGIVILTNSERSVQLIADIVDAWADRSGLSTPALASTARWIRFPVWILGGIALGLALRLGYGLFSGVRSFAPLSERDRIARAALAGLAVAAAGLWWAVGREFLGYFLPVIADWLGLVLAAIAALAVLTALFPRTDGAETS